MPVDEIIQEINRLMIKLSGMRASESDQGKKFLFGTLKNILKYAIANIAIFYSKQLQNMPKINYITKQNNIIEVPVDRIFLNCSLRRTVLLDVWSQIEFYFVKKVHNGESLETKVLIENYYKPSSVPDVIDFFRETRNSLHGNGTHNVKKKKINFVMDKNTYTLVPGEEVKFVDWIFLLNIIREALKKL